MTAHARASEKELKTIPAVCICPVGATANRQAIHCLFPNLTPMGFPGSTGIRMLKEAGQIRISVRKIGTATV